MEAAQIFTWVGLLKGAALMLFPRLAARKAQALGRAGFPWVVLVACCAAGGYLTWFGYGPRA